MKASEARKYWNNDIALVEDIALVIDMKRWRDYTATIDKALDLLEKKEAGLIEEYESLEVKQSVEEGIELYNKKQNGLLIELPVPIGSTVYRIDMFTSIQKCEKCRFYNHNESYEYSACNISYTDYCHANCYQIEKITNVDEKFIIYCWDDFGKTVFGNLKEAESMLKELRIEGLRTCSSTDWERR